MATPCCQRTTGIAANAHRVVLDHRRRRRRLRFFLAVVVPSGHRAALYQRLRPELAGAQPFAAASVLLASGGGRTGHGAFQ